MLRRACVILICLTTFKAFAESTAKYQVATIVDVKTHQTSETSASNSGSYDVSIQVNDTLYTVLYSPPLGVDTVKYKTGRSLLVLVGEKTIVYNDLLGQSIEVPIMNQRPAARQLK